eukprot:361698-Chlamydomonas_euryale.AAC.2
MASATAWQARSASLTRATAATAASVGAPIRALLLREPSGFFRCATSRSSNVHKQRRARPMDLTSSAACTPRRPEAAGQRASVCPKTKRDLSAPHGVALALRRCMRAPPQPREEIRYQRASRFWSAGRPPPFPIAVADPARAEERRLTQVDIRRTDRELRVGCRDRQRPGFSCPWWRDPLPGPLSDDVFSAAVDKAPPPPSQSTAGSLASSCFLRLWSAYRRRERVPGWKASVLFFRPFCGCLTRGHMQACMRTRTCTRASKRKRARLRSRAGMTGQTRRRGM